MYSTHSLWKHAISRAIVVSGSGIILGIILYQFLIFMPTMKASQFTFSSITIGVAYAALKNSSPRNGLAALFVWYVIITGLLVEFNWWLLILNLAYITGMAGATFVHQRAVKTHFIQGAIQRIVLAGAIIAIANALIVVFLTMLSLKVAISHATTIIGTIYYNLQLGALIGLGTGLGMELAEYLIGRFFKHQIEIEVENTAANRAAT